MKAAKGQPVKDPDVRFVGSKCTTRVFLRTDGLFAVTIDRGEKVGALRYETMRLATSLRDATIIAKNIAGGPR
jgi:hypothetical protein